MTIRFAAARRRRKSPTCKMLCRSVALDPVNDNAREPFGDAVVVEALRHFRRHGLGAAEQARACAQAAQLAQDAEGYRRWTAICRQFDRRMADALARCTTDRLGTS